MIINMLDFVTWIECSCRSSLKTSMRVAPVVIDSARFSEQMHTLFKKNFDELIKQHAWHVSETGTVLCPRCHRRDMQDQAARARKEITNG